MSKDGLDVQIKRRETFDTELLTRVLEFRVEGRVFGVGISDYVTFSELRSALKILRKDMKKWAR